MKLHTLAMVLAATTIAISLSLSSARANAQDAFPVARYRWIPQVGRAQWQAGYSSALFGSVTAAGGAMCIGMGEMTKRSMRKLMLGPHPPNQYRGEITAGYSLLGVGLASTVVGIAMLASMPRSPTVNRVASALQGRVEF